ncbi:MAG: 6-phosphogluconolactonase [Dehalococcoidia bacterium]
MPSASRCWRRCAPNSVGIRCAGVRDAAYPLPHKATSSTVTTIRTAPTNTRLAQDAADMVLEAALESHRLRGRFVWFLSGGTTPQLLYRTMAQEAYRSRMPWAATHVFWGDERWVPYDDPESNFRMAYDELLSHVPIPPRHTHPFATMTATPNDAAAAAERQLRSLFGLDEPRPDLVLLGLGDDGHTASLFPGSSALLEEDLLFAADHVVKLGQWRLTTTLPLLNAAHNILFIVAGESKAPAVRQVLEPQPETMVLPASLVRPRNGESTWLLDDAAAKLLATSG